MTPTDMYEFARTGAYSGKDGRDFYKDAEKAFNFSHFPEKLKGRIHSMAYEEGHAAGYSDIITQYFDLVSLVKLALGEEE